VAEYDDRGGDLLPQLVKFLVAFLDLLIERLVLDLELLEVDEVKPVGQLLLLFEDLLLVGQAVAEGDVLQAELCDLLVLLELALLLHLDELLRDLLARAGVDGVLRHRALQLLELRLNLLALRLLLIQLSLQLTRHLVVTVLRLLQVETHLVHVGQRVQVLVLVHLLCVRLLPV
jgi:hypothetical protein